MTRQNKILVSLSILFILYTIIIRIVIPFNLVFTDTSVKFSDPDCYVYMMSADKAESNLNAPLISKIVGTLGKVFGVNNVGAILPAILGILSVILIGLIGWFIFNKWVGIACLGFASIIGGEFLNRSRLGSIDHHVMDLFLSLLFVLFYTLALKEKKDRVSTAYFAVSLLSIMVMVLNSKDWILNIGIALLSLVILLPLNYKTLGKLKVISGVMFSVIVLIFLIVINFDFVTNNMKLLFDYYVTHSDVSEVKPLFINGSSVSLVNIVSQFGYLFLFGIVGFIIAVKKELTVDKVFLLTWCFVMFFLSILQARLAMYGSIAVVLMAGYFCYEGFGYLKRKQFKENYYRYVIIGVVLFISIVPLFNSSLRTSGSYPYLISKGWEETLDYLKKQPDGKVLTWWDYGYWIQRESRKQTLCDPGGGKVKETANYLMLGLNQTLKENGISYVIVDYKMVNLYWESISKGNYDLDKSKLYELYNGTLNQEIDGLKCVYESKEKRYTIGIDKGTTYITQSWGNMGSKPEVKVWKVIN